MDVYRVAPLGAPIDAVVEVPGSKSIANRALVCAALADGESVLRGVPGGDDTEVNAVKIAQDTGQPTKKQVEEHSSSQNLKLSKNLGLLKSNGSGKNRMKIN